MELNYRQGEILDLLQRFRDSGEEEKRIMMNFWQCDNEVELSLKLIDKLLESFEEDLLKR